jgi:phospholipase C
MLVLSPFSRGGHVASEVFDHTSQLRFLEERFGVKAPNISAWRRHTAGDLTSTLHPHTGDASVPTLPSTSNDRMTNVKTEGCTEDSVLQLTLDPGMPVYPVPVRQTMPTQETA